MSNKVKDFIQLHTDLIGINNKNKTDIINSDLDIFFNKKNTKKMGNQKTNRTEVTEERINFYSFENVDETLIIDSCQEHEMLINGERVCTFRVKEKSTNIEYLLSTHYALKSKISKLVNMKHDFEKSNVEIVYKGTDKHPTEKGRKLANFQVFTID
jgi:adenine-specific DNA glycosylase